MRAGQLPPAQAEAVSAAAAVALAALIDDSFTANPGCTNLGCPRTRTEIGHRTRWAETHDTRLDDAPAREAYARGGPKKQPTDLASAA